MKDFLKKFKDYQGTNTKLKAFAKKLEDIEDDYNDMFGELEEEIEEQEQGASRSYSQNRTEHDRLHELGLNT